MVSDKAQRSDETEFLAPVLEVLEGKPPAASRWLALSIAGFFALFIFWASTGSIEIVASAQGQLVPAGRVKVVQPFETSIVRAIHIEDGQHVDQGQMLLELDTTEPLANTESLAIELIDAQLELAKGVALQADDPEQRFLPPDTIPSLLRERTKQLVLSEHRHYKATRESLAAQIESRRASIRATGIEVEKLIASIPLTQELLDAQDALLKDGLTQKTNVIRLQQTLLEANAEKAKLSETLLSTKAAVTDLEAQLRSIDAQFQTNAIGLAREARKTIRLLDQNIKKEETRIEYRNLTAPVSGTIHQLSVNTIGAVVTSADPLVAIIPDNTPLEVEAFVLNKDRGFLQVGQITEVKLEAFSFTRYGTITGKISKIADDVIVHEAFGPVYKLSVELDTQEITADGRKVALKPGMTTTVEVKTGSSKIIDYFISPLLSYRDEAIRER